MLQKLIFILTFVSAKDGTLHISTYEKIELFSDYQYEFNSVTIRPCGYLFVEPYNPNTKIGGKLLILWL